MNELKLIHQIWKYAAASSVAIALFSPSKVALPAVIITGATVSAIALSPRNNHLEERVKNLEDLASK